jgi:hypothetical protein
MKKLMFFIVLLFFIQLTARAQTESTEFRRGNWELDITGSLGSIESNEDFTSQYYFASESEYDSRTYFLFGITPGYYLTDGLAFEPEIDILALEKNKPSFLLIGNLAYTVRLKLSNFFPFVRAGYGVTNSFQVPIKGSLTRFSDSMDIGVLNFGIGLKTVLTDCVLLRTEVNYRKFMYTEDNDYYNYKLNITSIALLFGFSVLL